MSEPTPDEPDELDNYILEGRTLEREVELERSLDEFRRLFCHDEPNDRALVVVGTSMLEIMMTHILVNFMVEDEGEVAELLRHDRALGAFSSRIRAAYCLGLIGKVIRDDLRHIAAIRNMFAHSLTISFDDAKVRSRCVALQFHRTAYVQPEPDASPRDLFFVGLHIVANHLRGMASLARSDRRRPRGNG